MKRLLFITLFSFFSISSFGQKIRFSDSTNVWHGFDWSEGALVDPISFPYTFYYTGDTIIHATAYKILNCNGTNSYIREDTVTKKVFVIRTIPPENDTTEQLLYDYSLNVGDTTQNNHISYYVSAKDSVIINTLSYHVWHLVPFKRDSVVDIFGNDFDVIEGIGCVNDPCFPIWPFTFEAITNLTCFNNEDTAPPLSHIVGPYFNNTSSCSLTGLDVKNIAGKNEILNLSPNPVTATLTITSFNKINQITIINLLGQTVYTHEYNADKIQVDVADLPGGMYLVKINGVEVRKFVKE